MVGKVLVPATPSGASFIMLALFVMVLVALYLIHRSQDLAAPKFSQVIGQ